MLGKFSKVILIILLLYAIPLVLALDTQINLKAKPSQKIQLIILHNEGPNQGRLMSNGSSYTLDTDSEGKASLTYSFSTETTLRLSVKIANEMDAFLDFKDIPVGRTVFIDLTLTSPTPVISNPFIRSSTPSSSSQTPPSGSAQSPPQNTSQTPPSTTPQTQPRNTSSQNAPVNNQDSQNSGKKPSILFYIIISIFLIAFLLFLIFILRKHIIKLFHSIISIFKRGSKEHIKTVKFSEKFKDSYHDNDLKLVLKKLEESQEEVWKLKNKEKEIREIEKRLKDDEARLKKLRGF